MYILAGLAYYAHAGFRPFVSLTEGHHDGSHGIRFTLLTPSNKVNRIRQGTRGSRDCTDNSPFPIEFSLVGHRSYPTNSTSCLFEVYDSQGRPICVLTGAPPMLEHYQDNRHPATPSQYGGLILRRDKT